MNNIAGMRASLARELKRTALLLAIALLAAIVAQHLWPLLVALLLYLIWHTRQLFVLYHWLSEQDYDNPPDNVGLWGDFYARLEHLLRKEQRAQGELHGIIERAQESVNAFEDAVIVIDRLGYLEFWNPAGSRFLGLRPEQDIGQPLTNIIRHPRFIEYLARGDFREPIEIPSPLERRRQLQFRVTEFGAGDRLILARDVTRLHHLEEMRKEFVANVSHELKTPLTVLKGYLETLLDTVPEEQSRLRRALQQMTLQSQRMEALVQDLLLLSRLENTEADAAGQVVELTGLLEHLRTNALALAPEKHQQIDLQVPADARLIANPAELESAIGNLLTNAVRYTPDNGHILIRYRQDEQGGHLSVIDDGIGIDPQHIPRITERFYRPDSGRAAHTGGTGLGLAIVKHVMLRHDGQLEIHSELGKGSTFTCHFPPHRTVGAQPSIS